MTSARFPWISERWDPLLLWCNGRFSNLHWSSVLFEYFDSGLFYLVSSLWFLDCDITYITLHSKISIHGVAPSWSSCEVGSEAPIRCSHAAAPWWWNCTTSSHAHSTAWQWCSHGGRGGGSRGRVPLWQRKICQKSGKRARKSGKAGKIGKKRKNRGKEEHREVFFTLPLMTDRAGYTTAAWLLYNGVHKIEILLRDNSMSGHLRYHTAKLTTKHTVME